MPCPQEDPNSPCAQTMYATQAADGWILAALLLFGFVGVMFSHVGRRARKT